MGPSATALKGIYEPIQHEIQRVEEILTTELAHENPFVNQLVKHSTKFQGKRVRPALLLHCAHILGKATDVHLRLGAVVELLHGATLVHDDVLDEALLRRQVKTLNNVWGNEASISSRSSTTFSGFHLPISNWCETMRVPGFSSAHSLGRSFSLRSGSR